MEKLMRRGFTAAGIATALVLGPIACGTAVLGKDTVASSVQTQLQGKGVKVENMTCPSDLEAVVGKSMRCEFTTGGQPVDAVVTVTTVDGTTAHYDVHTEARPVAKALLSQKVAELVGQQAGVTVDSSTCTGDLPPMVGGAVSCSLTSGTDSADFTVTVTSVDGGLVNFSIE